VAGIPVKAVIAAYLPPDACRPQIEIAASLPPISRAGFAAKPTGANPIITTKLVTMNLSVSVVMFAGIQTYYAPAMAQGISWGDTKKFVGSRAAQTTMPMKKS
jgi:hypothetical protein